MAIIILSLNQSECRKLLRSASSRIGCSRDTGIEESACKWSCQPLFFAIRRSWSKDLFSLCFLLERPLLRPLWDRCFLRTSGFNEKTLIFERTDDIIPCWYIWSLRHREHGVCSRLIQLSSAERSVFFISFLESRGCLERISIAVILTFYIEWLHFMKWLYKKFLCLRVETPSADIISKEIANDRPQLSPTTESLRAHVVKWSPSIDL